MFILQGCWHQVEKSAITSCKFEYQNYPKSMKTCLKGVRIARLTAEEELGFQSSENDVVLALLKAEKKCYKTVESSTCAFGVALFKEHAIKH